MSSTRLVRIRFAWLACVFLAADHPAFAQTPLFVMDTAFGDLPFETVQTLGYAGVSLDFSRDWPLEELDKIKLPLVAVYGGLALDTGDGRDAIERAIRRLKGRSTIVWITLTNGKIAKSSPDGDAAAVSALRPLADLAKENGVKLALYPHTGFWLERVDDAVRVANLVDRPNLGVTFNLCHFLRCDKAENLEARLKAAKPRLFLVTINGADADGTDWDRLIQPLDRGSYDIKRVLAMLKEIEFTGPIGLQGYGVPGDKKDNLARSMQAWTRLAHD